MEPTFTHDDMLTIRRALDGYIVYIKALYDNDLDKQKEIDRVQDLYNRIGKINVL